MDFQISGVNYRADKLNAFQQLHVFRRIGPLLPTLIPLFVQLLKDLGGAAVQADGKPDLKQVATRFASGDGLTAFAALSQPFLDGLASLPDESLDYVLKTCLAVVKRESVPETFVPMSSQGALLFDQTNLAVILPLVVRVIQDNLGPFFSGLLMSAQTSGKQLAA